MVVAGGAVIVEGQQGHHRDALPLELPHPPQHLFGIEVVEVADEDHHRLAGALHQVFAVRKCLAGVRAAAELGAKDDVDGIAELIGEVHDRCVIDHEVGFHRLDGGQHGCEDAGIDHRRRHGARLVNHQYDLPLETSLFAAISDEPLRHDSVQFGKVVAQVRRDSS